MEDLYIPKFVVGSRIGHGTNNFCDVASVTESCDRDGRFHATRLKLMKDTKSILTLLISSLMFNLEFDIRMGNANGVVVACDSKAKTDIIMILVRSEFTHRSSNALSGISF